MRYCFIYASYSLIIRGACYWNSGRSAVLAEIWPEVVLTSSRKRLTTSWHYYNSFFFFFHSCVCSCSNFSRVLYIICIICICDYRRPCCYFIFVFFFSLAVFCVWRYFPSIYTSHASFFSSASSSLISKPFRISCCSCWFFFVMFFSLSMSCNSFSHTFLSSCIVCVCVQPPPNGLFLVNLLLLWLLVFFVLFFLHSYRAFISFFSSFDSRQRQPFSISTFEKTAEKKWTRRGKKYWRNRMFSWAILSLTRVSVFIEEDGKKTTAEKRQLTRAEIVPSRTTNKWKIIRTRRWNYYLMWKRS